MCRGPSGLGEQRGGGVDEHFGRRVHFRGRELFRARERYHSQRDEAEANSDIPRSYSQTLRPRRRGLNGKCAAATG